MDKSIEISEVFAAAGKSIWFAFKTTATTTAKHAILTVTRRNELARQRYQLSNLDDDRLRDLGISREMAEKEAARPVWDDPLSTHQLSAPFIQKSNRFVL